MPRAQASVCLKLEIGRSGRSRRPPPPAPLNSNPRPPHHQPTRTQRITDGEFAQQQQSTLPPAAHSDGRLHHPWGHGDDELRSTKMQAPYVLLRMSLFPNKLKEANVLQSRPRTPTPACLPACLPAVLCVVRCEEDGCVGG